MGIILLTPFISRNNIEWHPTSLSYLDTSLTTTPLKYTTTRFLTFISRKLETTRTLPYPCTLSLSPHLRTSDLTKLRPPSLCLTSSSPTILEEVKRSLSSSSPLTLSLTNRSSDSTHTPKRALSRAVLRTTELEKP